MGMTNDASQGANVWTLGVTPATTAQGQITLTATNDVGLTTNTVIEVLVTPFLPTTAKQMREQLGVTDKLETLTEETAWGRLAPGTKIGPVAPLFPKRT